MMKKQTSARLLLAMVVMSVTISMLQAEEESNRRFFKLGKGGMEGLSGLPLGGYPLWKFHKYDGLSLKPVPIGLEIGNGIPAPPPAYMPGMPQGYENNQQGNLGGLVSGVPLTSYSPPSYPQAQPQPQPQAQLPVQPALPLPSTYVPYAPSPSYAVQPQAPLPLAQQYGPALSSGPKGCKTLCNDDYGSNNYGAYSSGPGVEGSNYAPQNLNAQYAPQNPNAQYAPAPASYGGPQAPVQAAPLPVSYGPSSGGASYNNGYNNGGAAAPQAVGSYDQAPQAYDQGQPQPQYAPAGSQYEQPQVPGPYVSSVPAGYGQQPQYDSSPVAAAAPASYDGYNKKRRSSTVSKDKNAGNSDAPARK